MDIWEANKLLIFVGFVIPGFVSLKTYNLLVPSDSKDSASQIIEAVAYSCVNYALLIGPIYWIDSIKLWTSHPGLYVVACIIVLLVAPIGWALLVKFLRETEFVRRAFPHPIQKPWDYVLGNGDAYWVIVTLKDGIKLAGRYDTKSFASSAPAREQIYLEESWVLNDDGGFDRPRENTAGIMILSDEIVAMEFFKITYGVNDVGSQKT